jgi:hypothetical protein
MGAEGGCAPFCHVRTVTNPPALAYACCNPTANRRALSLSRRPPLIITSSSSCAPCALPRAGWTRALTKVRTAAVTTHQGCRTPDRGQGFWRSRGGGAARLTTCAPARAAAVAQGAGAKEALRRRGAREPERPGPGADPARAGRSRGTAVQQMASSRQAGSPAPPMPTYTPGRTVRVRVPAPCSQLPTTGRRLLFLPSAQQHAVLVRGACCALRCSTANRQEPSCFENT